MPNLLGRLADGVGRHRRAVFAVWLAVLIGGGWFALHQQDYLQGGGWEVPGSQAKNANQLLRSFNGYSVAGLAVVVSAPPAGTEKTVVDGDRYRAAVCCSSPSNPFAAFGTTPASIAAKISRDERSDAALARDVAAEQPSGLTPSAFAVGKALSNLCADVIQLMTPAEIAAVAAAVPPEWRRLVGNRETTAPLTPAACSVWGVPPSPQVQRAPVTSSIPTIVLADEWDHVILPSEGTGIAQNLGNARAYELPGLDHIALLNFLGRDVSCPQSIAVAFLDRPQVFPSGACIASMREPTVAPAR
jgi:hypothetical protein